MGKKWQAPFTNWASRALPEALGSRYMKDIIEIRKDNLREVLGRYDGRVVALARAINKSQSLVNQWLSTKTEKRMSTETARHIEEMLDLPYGWMDNIHHEGAVPEILRDVIICTEQALNQEGLRNIPTPKKADLILAFAEFFTPSHPPTVHAIRRLIRAKI